MDDPNITIEEYIKLGEEKARKRGKVFSWETAKYGKIWFDEDVHDLKSVETEFPAIVFNDNLTTNETLPCQPTVSSLNNNEIDFRISFDESDDEDYTVVFDKNSFSYKIISTNDLKTDSENDNEKVNMSLFPSPEPSVSCIDDLDFFKIFENEFPSIVYNDALTSKSDFLTEPTLGPQHIDKFDFKDETSLSEYDEVEQNVLYFNDLFPFNIIYPDDQKSDKDNDDNEIDMIQSLGDIAVPPGDHRHQYLRFEGLQYTEGDIADYETRDRVYSLAKLRGDYLILEANVHELILEFFSTFRFGEAVLDLDLSGALQFQLGKVRRRMSWREFILALGLHTAEEMQTAGFGLYWAMSTRAGCWIGQHPLLVGPISEEVCCWEEDQALISGGQFVARLAYPFGLLTGERLQGLTITGPALPIIDMTELEVVMRMRRCLKAVPPLPRTQGERITQLDEEVHGMGEVLQGQREVLDSMARDLSRFTTWTITSLSRLMDRAGVPYTRYSESPVEYQRRTRQRTNGASTFTAPQQPDP
ncbi:hypothetical protein Tco_0744620 [Tanacetum coccineum]